MSNNIRVCPINFFDLAILDESPALAATMPATNAQDVARYKTARSTSAAAQTIKGTWGGFAYTMDSFFIFRHNGQGGSVRLRLYANSNYTGTMQDTGVLALPVAIDSGLDFGTPATAPDSASDPLLSDAPYFLFFAAFTAKSFQIDFSACARSYWDFGRGFIGKYVEAAYNPKDGMGVEEAYGDIQTRTLDGSLGTRAGAKWHNLSIDMYRFTDAERAIWKDLISIIQMNADVAISLFPGMGGRQERDHVWNMQLQASSTSAWSGLNLTQAPYKFTEV